MRAVANGSVLWLAGKHRFERRLAITEPRFDEAHAVEIEQIEAMEHEALGVPAFERIGQSRKT